MAETLSASYAEGSVCFVHIRNALDHSADPATAIVEAIRVLRRGGVLYCNHFRNEAEREGYRGFHQFNIDEEDGHMILWNRGMRVDVNRMTEGARRCTHCVSERLFIVHPCDSYYFCFLPAHAFTLSSTATILPPAVRLTSTSAKPSVMRFTALSYAFGNIADGKPMRVEYVDPLAPFYNEILDR